MVSSFSGIFYGNPVRDTLGSMLDRGNGRLGVSLQHEWFKEEQSYRERGIDPNISSVNSSSKVQDGELASVGVCTRNGRAKTHQALQGISDQNIPLPDLQ